MKLVKYPSKMLVTKTEEFNFDKYDPLRISDMMISLMGEHSGIGLSANQVGLNASIFVMKTSNIEDNDYLTAINPTIKEESTEFELGYEGCLSFVKKLSIQIPRPTWITVEFLDKFAQSCIMTLRGIDARCFQHEYDHLNGILFLSREYIPNIFNGEI